MRTLSKSFRQALTAIPGARWLYEGLVESPGTWLYRKTTLAYWSDPSLVEQLPRPYRFFFRYCAVQRYAPIGAELLLRSIIALRRGDLANDGIAPLRIGKVTAYLDLQDPRFLRVPAELGHLPDLLRRFVRPGDTFIDVGANHGTASIVAAGLVGSRGLVIAIEPQPRLAGLLRQLLAPGPARFEVHQVACSDCSGEVEFYIPRATSGSAGQFGGFSAVSRHCTIQVAARRLDDVLDAARLPGNTFIKLDVEGSEPAFLRGASRLILATSPALFIEMNPAALRAAGASKAELVGTLRELGYDRFVTRREPEQPRPLTDQATDTDLLVLPAAFGA